MSKKIKDYMKRIRRIEKLNGTEFEVGVGIKSNGEPFSDNPAGYGAYHDNNRFPFLDEGAKMARAKMSKGLKKNLKIKSIMTTYDPEEKLIEASKVMADEMRDGVRKYILDVKPQVGKKIDGRDLIDTWTLYDSIIGTVRKKSGKGRKARYSTIWEGE